MHTRKTLKRSTPHDENFDIFKFKKTRLGVLEGKFIKYVEVRIGGDAKSSNCEEPVSKRLSSIAGRSSRNIPDVTVGRLLLISK